MDGDHSMRENLFHKIQILRNRLGDACLLEEILDNTSTADLEGIVQFVCELWGYTDLED